MDKDLLDYYRSNLLYIRELASEFAKDFPKMAGRLEIGNLEVRDPFIERMLEGTAFLAARVEKKLDDGFPRLLESILNIQAPFIMAPLPSRGILELGANSTFTVSAGSEFLAQNSKSATPVCYSTVWQTTIPALKITQIRYTSRFDERELIQDAVSVLNIKIETVDGKPLSDCFPEDLDVFLQLNSSDASEIVRLLTTDLVAVYVEGNTDSGSHRVLDCETIMPALLTKDEVLETSLGQNSGIRHLMMTVTAPNLLKFIRIKGLQKTICTFKENAVEVRFYFKRHIPNFIHLLKKESLKLGCVPVVNLFKKRSSRSFIENNYEIDVFPDRVAVKDYEVWRIERVEVFNNLNETLCFAFPFFSTNLKIEYLFDANNFFNVHRSRKLFSSSKKLAKPSCGYRQSHVRISLSGPSWQTNREEAVQLAADLWCTNGELPLYLKKDTEILSRKYKKLTICRFFIPPSEPREAIVLSGKEDDWEKLSFLLLNLSSWLEGRGTIPVQFLRRFVHIWCSMGNENTKRFSEGISSVVCKPRMFRFLERGAIFYENGYSIEIELLPEYFDGVGVFTFGAVLSSLVNSFTPLNSVTEISIKTPTEGVIAKWKSQKDLFDNLPDD